MLQALLIERERRSLLAWPQDKDRWLQGEGVLWLDLQSATHADVEALAAEFRLHPTVVRACVHPEHRARLKEFKDHLLLVLNAVGRGTSEAGPVREIGRWRTLELNLVVGERYLITAHPDTVPAVSALFQRYLRGDESRNSLSYLLFTLLESVNSGYYAILDRVDHVIDETESLIFKGQVNQKVVDRLYALKRHILYLRRVLGPQRDALGALIRRDIPVASAEHRPYFVDAYEHTLRLFDLLDTYRDLVSSSLDAYLSTVNNQMSEVMKTLTIVSTIMLPLTLITGIFGMNFDQMPLVGLTGGFLIILGVMAALVIGMTIYFRWRKWM